MFNPDLSVLLKNHVSRYSLVTATAKRARAIADEAHFNGDHLTEKPVSRLRQQVKERSHGPCSHRKGGVGKRFLSF